MELADTADLKSAARLWAYGFESRPGHKNGVKVMQNNKTRIDKRKGGNNNDKFMKSLAKKKLQPIKKDKHKRKLEDDYA